MRAFEALARRHEAALYRTAVRVTGDPAEAEDAAPGGAAGRVAHTSTGSAATRRSRRGCTGWSRTGASRRCAAAVRAGARADAGTDVAAPDSPERAALLDLELAALGRAVQDLPDDLRVCWVLRELEGPGLRRHRRDHRRGGDGRARPHPPRARAAGGGDAGMEVDTGDLAAGLRPGRRARVGPGRGGPPARRARARTARTARPSTPTPGGSTRRCTAWPTSPSEPPPSVLAAVMGDGAHGAAARGGAAAGLAARAQPPRPRRGGRRAAHRRRRHGRDARPQLPHRAAGSGPLSPTSRSPWRPGSASTSPRRPPASARWCSRRASRRWACRCVASTSRWWTCGRRDPRRRVLRVAAARRRRRRRVDRRGHRRGAGRGRPVCSPARAARRSCPGRPPRPGGAIVRPDWADNCR